MTFIVELRKINKFYGREASEVRALSGVSLKIKKGEMIAIMGPSGSGKSTLMHIIGLLDRPTSGDILIDGKVINLKMADAKLAKLRSEKIGFVFQQFNLLNRVSALKNVTMPTIYKKSERGTAEKRAMELLSWVGLSGRESHKPSELSGGQIQRVAIARALINNPEIILADEPTGNLDSKSGLEVMKILTKLNKKGKTVIIITHDLRIASHAQKIISMVDGRVVDKNV